MLMSGPARSPYIPRPNAPMRRESFDELGIESPMQYMPPECNKTALTATSQMASAALGIKIIAKTAHANLPRFPPPPNPSLPYSKFPRSKKSKSGRFAFRLWPAPLPIVFEVLVLCRVE